MASSSAAPTIALFGATGGTGLCFLKANLIANPNARVNILARTPEKLTSTFPQSTYPYLNITKGDIRDIEAVKKVLLIDGVLVDKIVSTVGMPLKREGVKITGADPHLCEETAKIILSALSTIRSSSPSSANKYPEFIAISTTGISEHGRDIPIAMIPLYHMVLSVPHEDKKKMEEVITAYEGNWVLVRPSFLIDGKGKGIHAVRVGFEIPGNTQLSKKEIGYVITREDVGNWMFEELIRNGGNPKWDKKIVSITY
ncbi:hypothetical protein F5884DRAFT_394361 [Xylogone sp. PMI_703]|nr:hypothetical protein F5884DRAFT_394361 [Xylogone sp. PMI_703]